MGWNRILSISFYLPRNCEVPSVFLFYKLVRRNLERFPFRVADGFPTEWIKISVCSLFRGITFISENGNPKLYVDIPLNTRVTIQIFYTPYYTKWLRTKTVSNPCGKFIEYIYMFGKYYAKEQRVRSYENKYQRKKGVGIRIRMIPTVIFRNTQL